MFLRQKYPFQEGSLKCISLPLKSKGCFSSESMVSMAVLYFKRNQKLCTGKDSALCQRVFALVIYLCEVFTRPWDVGGFGQFKLHQALHSFGINVGVFPDLKNTTDS